MVRLPTWLMAALAVFVALLAIGMYLELNNAGVRGARELTEEAVLLHHVKESIICYVGFRRIWPKDWSDLEAGCAAPGMDEREHASRVEYLKKASSRFDVAWGLDLAELVNEDPNARPLVWLRGDKTKRRDASIWQFVKSLTLP